MGPQDPFSRPDRFQEPGQKSASVGYDSVMSLSKVSTLSAPAIAAIIGLAFGGIVGTSVVFDFLSSALIILFTSVVFAAVFFGAARIATTDRWKEAASVLFARDVQ